MILGTAALLVGAAVLSAGAVGGRLANWSRERGDLLVAPQHARYGEATLLVLEALTRQAQGEPPEGFPALGTTSIPVESVEGMDLLETVDLDIRQLGPTQTGSEASTD